MNRDRLKTAKANIFAIARYALKPILTNRILMEMVKTIGQLSCSQKRLFASRTTKGSTHTMWDLTQQKITKFFTAQSTSPTQIKRVFADNVAPYNFNVNQIRSINDDKIKTQYNGY